MCRSGGMVILCIREINNMPEKRTIERARRARREGKALSTQAGEFVREVIHDVREGKHGVRSAKQAIAIGLSKARRTGVKLQPPAKGKTSAKTRRSAVAAYKKGQRHEPVSLRRSRAHQRALKREGTASASAVALSSQTRRAARKRTAAERSAATRKAVRTKGHLAIVKATRKAARTRERMAA